MHEVMAAVARPRYSTMPDPIETADDRDKRRPAAIRLVDFRGDFDDYFEIKVVGPYPDDAARNADLARLRALPGDHGCVQFLPDRIGNSLSARVFAPGRFAKATRMVEFLAAWSGCTVAEYLGEDEQHPGQATIRVKRKR